MDNILSIFSGYSAGGSYFMPIIIFASFIAGIIASLSPCTLGILPLIIGYVGGYSKDGGKKLFVRMTAFSLGLSFVLSIIGAICAFSGRAFTSTASPVVMLIFASVIIILGLNLIGIIEIQFPALIKKMPQNTKGGIFIFPFIVGVFFALAASPCSSPLLLSIMAVSAVSGNILFAICLLFAFAMGQCIIIILAAMFTSLIKNIGNLAKYSPVLMKISGILLILTGIYIYYAIFSNIN